MKYISDLIKEEVYKCSKCGLCQSVCPVYLATKNEMYLARGRYVILNNFFYNKTKFSPEFVKNLDICLNCNECKNFCPSNIDAESIFTAVKHDYNFKSGIIPFHTRYFTKLFIHKIKSFLFKTAELYKPSINRVKKHRREYANQEKVVYFEGCFNRYINPSDKNASLNIIEKAGYNPVMINSECCGLPFFSCGCLERFDKNAQKIINSIPSNIKYIVCSCDSCYNTLKKIFINSPLNKKLIRLDELIRQSNINIPVLPDTVYHRTLSRKELCYLPDLIQIINKKGTCSLMENFFLIKYPKIATTLLENVFYKKEEIDNKTIITTCQLSKWGLKAGIETIKSNTKVCSYSEYINSAYKSDF